MTVQVNRPIRFSSRAKFITVLSIVVITLYLFSHVFHVMLPFIWAVITAYIFNPVVTKLQRSTRLPRFWWVVVLYIIGFGLLFWIGSVVIPLLTNQYDELRKAIPGWLAEADKFLNTHESITFFGYQFELVQFRDLEKTVFEYLNTQALEIPKTLPSLLFGVIEGFILVLVYLVVTFYLLLQAETIPNNFYRLIPTKHREEIRTLVGSIDRVLAAYIRGQFLLILIMSVLSFIALSILQIEFALVLAIATGILEIIPIVGPYMAGGIACTVALFQGTAPFGWEPWFLALVVALVYFILRQFEDQFIIPNLVGHIVNVHPIFVIFAILAGGSLAGGLGLLIAIPTAAVIKIVLVYLYNKLIDDSAAEAEVVAEAQQLVPESSDAVADSTPSSSAEAA